MDNLKGVRSPATVTIATVFANLITKASVAFSADECLVVEALRRSSNALADMPLADMGSYLRSLDDESLRGLANNVKGIYHELQFVRRENLDGDDVMARVFPQTNHPGADVVLSRGGEDIAELQLKATDHEAIVKEHLERYPDIPVAATDEVAHILPGVQSSGFTDVDLENDVSNTLADMADQAPIAQLVSATVTSGLVTAAMHAGDVLFGKVPLQKATRIALHDVGVAVTSTMLIDLLFS